MWGWDMNRSIWEKLDSFIAMGAYPDLPCPYCGECRLNPDLSSFQFWKSPPELVDKWKHEQALAEFQKINELAGDNILLGVMLAFSQAYTANKASKVPAKFVGFFKCESCDGAVSAAGTAHVGEAKEISSGRVIKVEYFSPPVPIFRIDGLVPENVRQEMLQAFSHFHSDSSSSGSKLRRAIEKLCLEMGAKGKDLHSRIGSLNSRYPKEVALLNALRLLGNEASHADAVSQEDLLDAFEVMDFILSVFKREEHGRYLDEKANKLNEKFSARKARSPS